MKKSIITLLLCSLFAAMIFGSCSTDKTKNNDPSTDNSTQNSDSVSTAANNANAPAYGENTAEKKENVTLSAELSITQTAQKIKYLKGVYTGDPCTKEYNTEDIMAAKRQTAQNYLDIAGVTNKVDFSVDRMYGITFTVDDYKMYAVQNTVSVTPASSTLGIDSTDEEIINFLKADKYLAALAKLAGIDLNNSYVDRDDLGSLDEVRSQDSSDEAYVIRTFTVCNKADSPTDLAFNLKFNNISFFVSESKASSSHRKTEFYGCWTDKENIVEAPLATTSFTDAKRQADASIQSSTSATDSISNKENVQCRIVYDSSIKDSYIIPCYRFYYTTDKNSVVSADVPCIDITQLV